MNRTYLTVLLATMALASSACSAGESIGRATEADWPADTVVQEAVLATLSSQSGIDLGSVTVRVTSGTVALSGTVRHLAAADGATRRVSRVRGVKAIRSSLNIEPGPVSDADLIERIQRKFELDPSVDERVIFASAREGHVDLTGIATSFERRRAAERAVRNVKGVRSVSNQITLVYSTTSADEQIAEAVDLSIRSDALLYNDDIDVAVASRVVTLSGRVGSLFEKKRAIDLCWIEGVEAVRSDPLTVVIWADPTPNKKQSSDVLDSDGLVATAVRSRVAAAPLAGVKRPEVGVSHGRVTLSGKTASVGERGALLATAHAVAGVKSVEDDLTVLPPVPSAPTMIRHDVESALELDPFLAGSKIVATVDATTVRLAGTASTRFALVRAIELSAGVMGVTDVMADDVAVQDSAVVDDPVATFDARRASDAILSLDEVRLDSDGAEFALRGKVGSLAERDLLADLLGDLGIKASETDLSVDFN